MREYLKFYIDGKWVEPTELKTLDVENPATEAVVGKIALGNAADVDKAVKAARKAFATWSQTTREERIEVLGRILAEYQKRFGDLATAVTEEMGAAASLSQRAQEPVGMGDLATAVARSPKRFWYSVRMRPRTSSRSSRLVWLQVAKALRAAFTALSTSLALPSAIWPTTSSVAGFSTSRVFSSVGSTH
jgi:acyl-CoA reductase-like NAD-dependent aldehyde dehydrogenase